MPERHDVGIIGYGRFGQLWTRIMEPHHRVRVTDRASVQHEQFLPLPELCSTSRAIFLCVPINQVEDVVRDIAPHLRPGTTVFDMCSVKVHPARILTQQLGGRTDLTLIATHPMFGPDSAEGGVVGLPMVVWRLAGDEHVYGEWVDFFGALGIRTVEMSPDEHDRLAAYSQGVTHYIGRVLDRLELRPTPIDTEGFRILRSLIAQTCNDSRELFLDLQRYNPYTQEMRLRLQAALDEVHGELQ